MNLSLFHLVCNNLRMPMKNGMEALSHLAQALDLFDQLVVFFDQIEKSNSFLITFFNQTPIR